jgi:hypothetical protein
LLTAHHTCNEFAAQELRYDDLIKRHGESWHKFARDEGYNVKMQDIILITGRSLTKNWAMFAYDSRPEGEASFRVEVDSISSSVSAGVWGRWFSEQSIHTNRGPIGSMALELGRRLESNFPSSATAGILSATGSAANPESLMEYNQCVFIKGIRVQARSRFPRVLKAGAGPHIPNIGGDQDEGGFSDAMILDMDATHELDVSESAKASHIQGTYLSLTSCASKSNQLSRGNGERD